MPPEPIALVGSGCRFTGDATSPSKLWQLLANPTDLSRPVPGDRFSATGFFHQDAEHHGTTNSPHGYWLSQDLHNFDAAFFNITRKEAEAMDPQQRLLLEVVYEALESAGYDLKSVAGHSVGVYTGVMTTDYRSLSERDELNASQYAATGNASSIIANRISYFYDFHGPSMTIDTACSASLVALHQAVLGLRAGEAEMACVAGVNLMLTPEQFISESDLHMLSPTGHCRMWDTMADGYARGEGVAAIFIKTLSQALAAGDNIQAIIRHTGVNSDGKTQGITLPNPTAQTALIRKTYEIAGLNPQDPDHRPQYFEAHGESPFSSSSFFFHLSRSLFSPLPLVFFSCYSPPPSFLSRFFSHSFLSQFFPLSFVVLFSSLFLPVFSSPPLVLYPNIILTFQRNWHTCRRSTRGSRHCRGFLWW